MGKRYNNYNQVSEEEVKPADENFMEAPEVEAEPVKEEVKPVETTPAPKTTKKDNVYRRGTVTI